ncbi:MAG: hypothetical protein JO337_12215 [Acidimicrobiales bacterium]|nr:hypothetical protein [Acidimicrobiales bacterium]
MSRNVAVVAHSHWDREWSASFESYRVRLTAMMDRLIDVMGADPEYSHFHLDGQTAIVDDYLGARPDQTSRLQELVRTGRLGIGPWYVLMDEFCVSGETIVRNLQLGLARSGSLGAPEPAVGYLPDMFGHVAQMPQLLVQAGLDHAVVWRGVPGQVGRAAFWWSAPDGSTVRAEYLPVGYANGAFLPDDEASLVRRVSAHERELEQYLPEGWPLLLMNGSDQQGPQTTLPGLLRRANKRPGSPYLFRQTSLAGYLRDAPDQGLPEWRGELRSGARAPILMGVLSSRVDLKQAAAATEVALERMAEPLATLWLPPEDWPGDLLGRAWLEVIRNSAHDSICGCSADEVGRAVASRYDTANAAATATVEHAVAVASMATRASGPMVVNPTRRERRGLVEIDLPGTEAPDGTQQVSNAGAVVVERRGWGRDLAVILARLAADGVLGSSAPGRAAQVRHHDGLTELTIYRDPTRPAEPGMAAVMAEAWAVAGAAGDQRLVVRVRQSAWQRVVASVEVPGWGWAVWDGSPTGPPLAPVSVGQGHMDNGLVSLQMDPRTGTFALDGTPGQNLIVDEPDCGDSYNFSPSAGAPKVTEPIHVSTEIIEAGPLRGVLRVCRRYRWMQRLENGAPFGHVETEVISDLEVRAGERAVRITTSFENHSRDHRVRVCFPLARPADRTEAECAFTTVIRGREAEGGPHEHPLPAFPSRRFVTAADTTITHQGLLEYELVESGRVLALTLLRATGVIARPAPPYRPVIAGPPVPVRDGQMPGPHVFRYAVARRCDDPWALAEETWTPLVTTRAVGAGLLPDKGQRLRLEGAQVSALYRQEGAIEVRVFNPTGAPVTVKVPNRSGWLVNLAGDPQQRWEGEFPLGPWAIATARLDGEGLD